MIWVLILAGYIYGIITTIAVLYPQVKKLALGEELTLIRSLLLNLITIEEFRSQMRIITFSKVVAFGTTVIFWPIVVAIHTIKKIRRII